MTAGALQVYGANKDVINLSDLVGAPLYMGLVDSGYVPNGLATGHTTWTEVSAFEIAAGNGYTAGGVALASLALAITSGNVGWKLSSADAAWTASGGDMPAWRYGILYVNSASFWGKSYPLVAYFLGDAAIVDVPATPNTYTLYVSCPSTGWLESV